MKCSKASPFSNNRGGLVLTRRPTARAQWPIVHEGLSALPGRFDWGMSDKTACWVMAQRQGRQGLRQGLAGQNCQRDCPRQLTVEATYCTGTADEASRFPFAR